MVNGAQDEADWPVDLHYEAYTVHTLNVSHAATTVSEIIQRKIQRKMNWLSNCLKYAKNFISLCLFSS